jgi:FemAB-related protein (PEP-CTERM system-associated)
MTKLDIFELQREDENAWDAYVHRSDTTTFYHQIGWKNIVEKTYKHKSIYLISKEEGEINGILPIFFLKSILFGKKLVSVPFAPYGSVCADNEMAENALIEKAKKITGDYKANYLELRYFTMRKDNSEFSANNNYVTFLLNLTKDPDVVMNGFNNKVRNAIRKALRSDLEISWDNNLKEFYSIYSKNMRELGSPPHSYTFFNNLMHEFSNHVKIIRVQMDSRTIGALFLISFKHTLISGWAASDKTYQKFNPNNLLYWEVIRYGCEKDYKFFDFGRSTFNSGTFNFKKPWGAEPKQLCYRYYLSNMKKIPDTSQSNPKRQIFAKVWRRLPLRLTTMAGSYIRKTIP